MFGLDTDLLSFQIWVCSIFKLISAFLSLSTVLFFFFRFHTVLRLSWSVSSFFFNMDSHVWLFRHECVQLKSGFPLFSLFTVFFSHFHTVLRLSWSVSSFFFYMHSHVWLAYNGLGCLTWMGPPSVGIWTSFIFYAYHIYSHDRIEWYGSFS